jgi:hypothetical protein
MAERLVDLPEAVEVEQQQRRHGAEALAARDREPQPVGEQAAVGQPGHGVVLGEEVDALLGLLALGDVVQSAVDPVRRTRRVAHHARPALHRAHLAVGEHDAEFLGQCAGLDQRGRAPARSSGGSSAPQLGSARKSRPAASPAVARQR